MTKARDLPLYMTAAEVESVMLGTERRRHRRLPVADAGLICLIMWRAGLRIAEALALKYEHLDLADDPPTLRVHLGKGNRTRIVPVHAELAEALRVRGTYRSRQYYRPTNGVIDVGQIVLAGRSTVHRWIKDAAAAAARAGGLDPVKAELISAHTFRHSFARHMLANGVKINTLQQIMGHKDLASTMIYLELLPDPEHAMAEVP